MNPRELIYNLLDGIRKDIITDLHAKDISDGDLEMKINFGDDFGELVGNHYWYYLVHGRKPGKMPPIDSIQEWVEKKGIVPDGNISLRSLAFLIARKIGREGTDIYLGRRAGISMWEIIDNNNFDLREALSEQIDIEVKEALKNLFEKK